MRKNHLLERYNDKHASFLLYFKKTMETQEMEDIHQMRLSIKKLRAIAYLLELAIKDFLYKKEYFALFSGLFSFAGEVREVQVTLEIIQKSKAKYLVPYKDYLKEIQRDANKKMLENMQTFDHRGLVILHESIMKEISELSANSILQQSAKFILAELEKVRVLESQLPDDRKLHKIRIHLKAVLEVLTIMMEVYPSVELEEFYNYLKPLDRQIGKWHDYIVLSESLKNFLYQIPTKMKARYLNNLIERTEYQQAVRQKEIQVILIQFFTEATLKRIENLIQTKVLEDPPA